jgi:phosphohistidine swiveling domain-containing protein
MSKDKFLELYGHLRPGTYDITSKSYSEGFDDYIDMNYSVLKKEETTKFQLSKNTKDKILQEIKKNGLNFSVKELIDFIIKATEAREKAKFEFTKNINSVLELIFKIGSDYNIDRDDLSYLNLDEILKYKNSSSRIDFANSIKYNISKNRQKYLITSAIKLPELIFDIKDVDMFYYSSMKPNFITQHKTDGYIVALKNNRQIDIEGKIVFIQSADPGYDWIFGHKIKALVTKYGGAASHMAIRCAEFDLPAAIGCGDKIYDDLITYKSVTIDCANEIIKGIA